jgi:hypothetical protein
MAGSLTVTEVFARFGESFGRVDVEFAQWKRDGAGIAEEFACAGVAGELCECGEE